MAMSSLQTTKRKIKYKHISSAIFVSLLKLSRKFRYEFRCIRHIYFTHSNLMRKHPKNGRQSGYADYPLGGLFSIRCVRFLNSRHHFNCLTQVVHIESIILLSLNYWMPTNTTSSYLDSFRNIEIQLWTSHFVHSAKKKLSPNSFQFHFDFPGTQ